MHAIAILGVGKGVLFREVPSVQECPYRDILCCSEENLVAAEKVNFVKEIEMMKGVSGGENALRHFVVNMLGCVTTQEPMLLILEFVSHGDLQSYLRAIRKKVKMCKNLQKV